jgi:hypothetical protein
VTASLSLLIVLASVGADFEQRLSDARLSADTGISTQASAWYDELARYRRLVAGSGLQIVFLSLVLLVLVGMISRRGKSSLAFELSARSVTVALVLLAFAPTKQPEHFGALVGMTAVAIAGQASRFARLAPSARRMAVQPSLVFAMCIVTLMYAFIAFAITWSRPHDPTPEVEAIGHHSVEAAEWAQLGAPVLPIVVLLLVVLAARSTQRGSGAFHPALWRVASCSVPIIVVPTLVFASVIAAVTALTVPGWTLPRQSVDFARRGECGLGDSTFLLQTPGDKAIPLSDLIKDHRTLVMPNLVLYFPCARQPSIENGIANPPDYIIAPTVPASPRQPISVRYTASPFYGVLDLFRIRRIPRDDAQRTFAVFEVDRQLPGARVLHPSS